MRTILVLLPFLLLAGCSGADRPGPAAPPAVSRLAEACPEAERVLQHVDVTDAASRERAAARIRGLATAAGDDETRTALAAVVSGLRQPHGWKRAFGDLASACASAGAPVFD